MKGAMCYPNLLIALLGCIGVLLELVARNLNCLPVALNGKIVLLVAKVNIANIIEACAFGLLVVLLVEHCESLCEVNQV